MDVYIAKLRKYLKEDDKIEIVNIHGNGFRTGSSCCLNSLYLISITTISHVIHGGTCVVMQLYSSRSANRADLA